jgi:hypothetical protein
MRNPACLSALLLAWLLQAPTIEPGWTSLFNGTDFTGWKISKPESFRIENGVIVANGVASHAYYDGPFRNHNFKNFELKVDVMTSPNGNGGVYVLTEFEATGGNVRASGNFPSKGFEIQVNNTYRVPIKTGSLYHVSDVNDAVAKDEEWFTIHIVVKDKNIVVKVNDKQTVDWTQPADWNGGREGPGRAITGAGGTIALQAHDPKSTVYFKNIRIKPLD